MKNPVGRPRLVIIDVVNGRAIARRVPRGTTVKIVTSTTTTTYKSTSKAA